jgi:hypothetical protein
VHIASFASKEKQTVLTELGAFKTFQKDLKNRCGELILNRRILTYKNYHHSFSDAQIGHLRLVQGQVVGGFVLLLGGVDEDFFYIEPFFWLPARRTEKPFSLNPPCGFYSVTY